MQTQTVDDTGSHIKEIKCHECSKDFLSKATLLKHEKKSTMPKAQTFLGVTTERRKLMLTIN